MSQIEITLLKQADIPSKKVLSCSFFVMQGGYRDTSIYKDALQKLVSFKSKRLEGFEFRIYTDDSGKDFVLSISQNEPHVSVYHYDCPFFREGNGHTGTFGTLVRFLPLFESGLDVVWITDIDVFIALLDPDILKKMKQYKRQIYVDTMVCYQRKPWALVDYPIIAHKFISFVTFPKQLLTRFLTKLINGDYSEMIDAINNYNERKSPNLKFPYGTDELFINNKIYAYIKKHEIPVFILRRNAIGSIVKYHDRINMSEKDKKFLDDFSYRPTKDQFPRLKNLYKRVIPIILDEYPCMQIVLDNIDNFSLPKPGMGWSLDEELPKIKVLT
jgi:hypothetical protein